MGLEKKKNLKLTPPPLYLIIKKKHPLEWRFGYFYMPGKSKPTFASFPQRIYTTTSHKKNKRSPLPSTSRICNGSDFLIRKRKTLMLKKIIPLVFKLFLCFVIYIWKVWFWNHSVSLRLSEIFVLFIFEQVFVFALTQKCYIPCTLLYSLYEYINILQLYLLSQPEGGFTREESTFIGFKIISSATFTNYHYIYIILRVQWRLPAIIWTTYKNLSNEKTPPGATL